ncbi:MAG: TetR/AcrR family transcriptional regulator [Hydrogenophaga sp.]|nr:TetR/AcrR family transcriptional regulator [Hydrogenophaga sp.]
MTRTRADDYEDKKATILDKAAALIARKGFDQATMQDVAKACGTSKSHIYHYFPSKEDLLYAIVYDHVTRQAADLERIVAQHLPAEDRFQQFVESFMQGAARERDEHIILMNDLKYLPRAELKTIRSLEVRMTELLNDLLIEINPGIMGTASLRKPYALLLFGMMIWTFSWYRPSGDISPRELAARISDLFVNGFKAPPSLLSSPNGSSPARKARAARSS